MAQLDKINNITFSRHNSLSIAGMHLSVTKTIHPDQIKKGVLVRFFGDLRAWNDSYTFNATRRDMKTNVSMVTTNPNEQTVVLKG